MDEILTAAEIDTAIRLGDQRGYTSALIQAAKQLRSQDATKVELIQRLTEQLADSQKDTLALVHLFTTVDTFCLHCKAKIAKALARPGVKALFAGRQKEQPYFPMRRPSSKSGMGIVGKSSVRPPLVIEYEPPP